MMNSEEAPILQHGYSTNYDAVIVNNCDTHGTTPDCIGNNGVNVASSTQKSIDSQTKIYKRRWYVLMVFSLTAFVQGGYWNTWGPIADSSEEAFRWTDADIALLSSWGPIAYVVSSIFFSWLIDVKGLRIAILCAAFLSATGAGVRCITDEPPYVTWTVNIGQLLIGLGGPVAMGVPPALSATWFPPHERTTATAIGAVMNSFGVGTSFLIGPYLVSVKPSDNTTLCNNKTRDDIYNNCTDHSRYKNDTGIPLRIKREKEEIMKLMYIEAAFAALIFLMALLYLPAKPKLPPSITASIERFEFKTGFKKLMRNSKFWMLCFSYGVSLGVYGSWQGVLDVNLKPHNISENEAGWLGFFAILASSTAALVVARFADVFSKHLKFFLLLLNTGGMICMVWFAILINGFIPSSEASLYASVILGTLLMKATPPLYFETACEVTYPVSEGVTNSVLTLVNNIAGLIFLFVQMIPNIGTAWENWTVIGAILFCIPVLGMMKERYNRLEIDDK